jgi:hypothetical protein
MEEIQEQQETQTDEQALMSGLERGAREREREQDRVEMLDQLTDDDIDSASDVLDNLTTKDIPSGNFDAAEANELRNYLDVVHELEKCKQPHPGQLMTGVMREVAHGDSDADRDVPTRDDVILNDTFIEMTRARISKGKDGKLLGLSLRSITESVLRRGDSDGGGLLGKIK